MADQVQPGEFAQRLQFLWDQYNKIVHLTVIMSGATIALLISVGLESGRATQLKSPEYLVGAIVLAGIAGVLALVWRYFAQILMEGQIYGPRAAVVDYFRDSRLPLALTANLKGVAALNEVAKVLSCVLLLCSWITAIALLLLNIDVGTP